MNVLVTGASGFIGKNLSLFLSEREYQLYKYSHTMPLESLEEILPKIDFIFHLAGVNRPVDKKFFYEGNSDFTETLIQLIEKQSLQIPLLFTSSKQAGLSNDYGKSKLLSEEMVKAYSIKNNTPVFIYQLPGVFGKWCRPNYNSVIATWCHEIARDNTISIDDRNKTLELVYIDDVLADFISQVQSQESNFNAKISTVYQKKLGEIADLLYTFKTSRETLLVPRAGKAFERALYATYLSYLPKDTFSYELKQYKDDRGVFSEFIKTHDSGQVSVSTTKPGESIVRGNHYHHTKNEKFLVVKGKALIEERDIYSKEKVTYEVSAETLTVVEMIPGYTHNIRNISDEEMVLVIWANEVFDKSLPDTYFLEV